MLLHLHPIRKQVALTLVSPAVGDRYRIWMEENMKTNWCQWTGVATLSGTDLQSASRACGFLDGTTIDGTKVLAATGPNDPDVQPY